MPRQRRSDLPDGEYHISTRGVDETMVFRDDGDRLLFLFLLMRAAERFHWELVAYCLMGTHYHILLRTTREQLSAGMHFVNFRYAQAFNEKYDRHGHLWGDRFKSRLVESEDHHRKACRYIALNPVRAGLCKEAEDWPWSWSVYGVADSAAGDGEPPLALGTLEAGVDGDLRHAVPPHPVACPAALPHDAGRRQVCDGVPDAKVHAWPRRRARPRSRAPTTPKERARR